MRLLGFKSLKGAVRIDNVGGLQFEDYVGIMQDLLDGYIGGVSMIWDPMGGLSYTIENQTKKNTWNMI